MCLWPELLNRHLGDVLASLVLPWLPYFPSVFLHNRFHKLAWSAHGQEGVNACGVLAGGSDNGTITLWSADKIIR